MRIRTIKPEFFKHEELFELEQKSKLPIRVAFVGLWCAADREGRFKWRPRQLGTDIIPYDQVDFSRVLDALTTRGFVSKYRVGNEWFGVIPSFPRHQVINNRERDSEIPDISQAEHVDASSTREARDALVEKFSLSGREGKGREQGREQGTPSAVVVDEVRKLPLFIDTKITGSTVVPASLAKSIPFLEVWKSWLEHLKQKRKPATLHAQDLQLRRLAEWGEERAIAAIRISIEKNWQSIYEDTTNGDNRTTSKPDRNAGTSNAGRIGQYDGIGKVR